MRLSEAVMMGMSLVKFNYHTFLRDGEGCLIGAGYMAVTGKASAWKTDMVQMWPWLDQIMPVPDLMPEVKRYKPSLPASDIISMLAIGIDWKDNTLEQAVDWIRSVEPAEPAEPSQPDPAEVLAEIDEAVRPMSIYERWERSRPEVRG